MGVTPTNLCSAAAVDSPSCTSISSGSAAAVDSPSCTSISSGETGDAPPASLPSDETNAPLASLPSDETNAPLASLPSGETNVPPVPDGAGAGAAEALSFSPSLHLFW